MRHIENRQFMDKVIVYGGMVFTLLLLFVLWYFFLYRWLNISSRTLVSARLVGNHDNHLTPFSRKPEEPFNGFQTVLGSTRLNCYAFQEAELSLSFFADDSPP